MDSAKEKRLPYQFDLLFDVKTAKQLRAEYRSLKERVELIEKLCQEHGISLD